MWRVAVLPLMLVACLRDTAFHCTTNTECGAGGTCERGYGVCSVVDPSCASGSRFGSSAGTYANQCVGDNAPNDATLADAPAPDAPTGCPASSVAITGGQAGHTYRRSQMSQNWLAQRSTCAAASSKAYLAIPDDQAELAAIATLSASTATWVGITDSAMENTFLTVKGAAAAFLPWDTGEPDDQGPGEDCVIIQTSTAKLRDERCTTNFRAVCECDP